MNDRRPPTTDRRTGAEPASRPAARRLALAALAVLVGLAPSLAGCGGGDEMTNRDRLPRRNPTEMAPSEPPADTTEAPEEPGYQPVPIREGLFTSYGDYERQRAAAVADLEGAVGTPSAATAAECKTLAVGAKACGGPRSFVVYSATGDAELDVIRRAARVTALDREANEQFGLSSDCMLLTAPEVAVENGVCVAR